MNELMNIANDRERRQVITREEKISCNVSNNVNLVTEYLLSVRTYGLYFIY